MAGKGGRMPGAGRPKGSRNKATVEVQELAKKYAPDALATLAKIMKNGEAESARIAAANALLDRGHGRPAQAVIHQGGDKPVGFSDESLSNSELARRLLAMVLAVDQEDKG